MNQLGSEQSRAALLGHLVGDAVGVPYEFQSKDRIPAPDSIDMRPPAGFDRSHPHVPPGAWSDDGALTLALLHSLQSDPQLNLADAATRMLAWLRKGTYSSDGIVFDCGITVRMGLSTFERGTPAEVSGLADSSSNGNGALMRSTACLLVPFSGEHALVSRAMQQGVCTHRHLRSQVTCAAYALMCWRVGSEGAGVAEAVLGAFDWLRTHLDHDALQELDVLEDAKGRDPRGTGYVVDTFWSAVWAVRNSGSYKECIQAAIGLGEDTDTTACVAGAIAGLVYGEKGIPEDWLAGLIGRDRALHLLERGSWLGTHVNSTPLTHW